MTFSAWFVRVGITFVPTKSTLNTAGVIIGTWQPDVTSVLGQIASNTPLVAVLLKISLHAQYILNLGGVWC